MLLATHMNRDRDSHLVNGATFNMKTSIIPPSILPLEKQPNRVKTPIRTSTNLWLIGKVQWFWPEWCCWSQISLGFGFLPVVKLILHPVLISRKRPPWSSPCIQYFFFFSWKFSWFILSGRIYFFVTNASKILSFQPWAPGNLNISQLFQGHVELVFPSWILTVHWARSLFFVSHML